MLPAWVRSWFTQTSPPRPGRAYYAHCAACLSLLEVDPDGRLMPADAREAARWRQVVRNQVAEMGSLTAALMERGT